MPLNTILKVGFKEDEAAGGSMNLTFNHRNKSDENVIRFVDNVERSSSQALPRESNVYRRANEHELPRRVRRNVKEA